MGVTNNSLITAPVSIADVESVIGTANHDLGSLCIKDNINIGSLCKPMLYEGDINGHILENSTISVGGTRYIPANGKHKQSVIGNSNVISLCGINYPFFSGTNSSKIDITNLAVDSFNASNVSSAQSYASKLWEYNDRTTYRLTDFDHYNNNEQYNIECVYSGKVGTPNIENYVQLCTQQNYYNTIEKIKNSSLIKVINIFQAWNEPEIGKFQVTIKVSQGSDKLTLRQIGNLFWGGSINTGLTVKVCRLKRTLVDVLRWTDSDDVKHYNYDGTEVTSETEKTLNVTQSFSVDDLKKVHELAVGIIQTYTNNYSYVKSAILAKNGFLIYCYTYKVPSAFVSILAARYNTSYMPVLTSNLEPGSYTPGNPQGSTKCTYFIKYNDYATLLVDNVNYEFFFGIPCSTKTNTKDFVSTYSIINIMFIYAKVLGTNNKTYLIKMALTSDMYGSSSPYSSNDGRMYVFGRKYNQTGYYRDAYYFVDDSLGYQFTPSYNVGVGEQPSFVKGKKSGEAGYIYVIGYELDTSNICVINTIEGYFASPINYGRYKEITGDTGFEENNFLSQI